MLSFTMMFVRVMLPQLETTPLIVWLVPTRLVVQFLVTKMQAVDVTGQGAVALAWTGVPQTLVAVTVTVFVLPAQVAVNDLLYASVPPAGRVAMFVTAPRMLSFRTTLVSVTLPQ